MRVKITKYEELLKEYRKKLDGGGDAGDINENRNGLTKLPRDSRRPSLTPSVTDIVTPTAKRIERSQMISEDGVSRFLDK